MPGLQLLLTRIREVGSEVRVTASSCNTLGWLSLLHGRRDERGDERREERKEERKEERREERREEKERMAVTYKPKHYSSCHTHSHVLVLFGHLGVSYQLVPTYLKILLHNSRELHKRLRQKVQLSVKGLPSYLSSIRLQSFYHHLFPVHLSSKNIPVLPDSQNT